MRRRRRRPARGRANEVPDRLSLLRLSRHGGVDTDEAPAPGARLTSERESTIAIWKGKHIRELEAEVARLTALLQKRRPFNDELAQKTIDIQVKEIDRLTAALATMEEAGLRNGVALQREAREAERERMAKLADDLGDSDKNDIVLHNDTVSFCAGYETACREIAAAIRSTP